MVDLFMTMTAPVTKQNVKNESTAELTCVCAMKCTTGLNVHMYLLDFNGAYVNCVANAVVFCQIYNVVIYQSSVNFEWSKVYSIV